MRKAIIGFTIGFGLLTALGVTSTTAAPAPSTTVVFSCDRGVGTAQATVGLKNTFLTRCSTRWSCRAGRTRSPD